MWQKKKVYFVYFLHDIYGQDTTLRGGIWGDSIKGFNNRSNIPSDWIPLPIISWDYPWVVASDYKRMSHEWLRVELIH